MSNFMKSGIQKDRPMFVIEGKPCRLKEFTAYQAILDNTPSDFGGLASKYLSNNTNKAPYVELKHYGGKTERIDGVSPVWGCRPPGRVIVEIMTTEEVNNLGYANGPDIEDVEYEERLSEPEWCDCCGRVYDE